KPLPLWSADNLESGRPDFSGAGSLQGWRFWPLGPPTPLQSAFNFVPDSDRRFTALGFGPDGKAVLTAFARKGGTRGGAFVQLQDAATGAVLGQLLDVPQGYQAVFSPDGKTVLTAADRPDSAGMPQGKETILQRWEVG